MNSRPEIHSNNKDDNPVDPESRDGRVTCQHILDLQAQASTTHVVESSIDHRQHVVEGADCNTQWRASWS
jgi:hypothetical protein